MSKNIETILRTLENNHNSQIITAETLGCSRQYVSQVVARYGSTVEEYRDRQKAVLNHKQQKNTEIDTLRHKAVNYLNDNNMTKTELAKRCGMSNSHLSLFLGGNNSLSDKKLEKIRKVLK